MAHIVRENAGKKTKTIFELFTYKIFEFTFVSIFADMTIILYPQTYKLQLHNRFCKIVQISQSLTRKKIPFPFPASILPSKSRYNMIAYHKVLTDAQKYIRNILCITVNHHEPDLNNSQKTRPQTPTASKVIPQGSRITIV